MKTTTEVTRRVRGAVKQLGQTIQGRMGIMATLAREHGEMAAIMDRIMMTRQHDMQERRELFDEVSKELQAHGRAEDRVLYARVAAVPELADRVIQFRRERQTIEILLDELSDMDVEHPAWLHTFGELESYVARHVYVEEHELFPVIHETLGSDELEALDRRYASVKRVVLNE